MGRETLHRLVEELPVGEVHTAERVLEYLRNVGSDPVLRAFLAAPLDDEPLTPDEKAAVAEAEEEIAQGAATPWEEVLASLGQARKT